MKFVPSNRDDIVRYYRNTYVKFKEYGDMLFFISTVDFDKITGKVEDGRPFTLHMSEEHPYEVDYVLPHKSFFQFDKHAMLLERIPAKQFFRGLREDNTKITYSMDGKNVQNIGLSFEVLKAFVNKQQFFTLLGAHKAPASVISCVLNSRMMFHRVSGNIYIDFVPVAKVDYKTKTVTMLKGIFRDEVVSYINSTSELWEIK